MINRDLYRSYKQYKKQLEIGYKKISLWQKMILSVLFFALMPLAILQYCCHFRKNRTSTKLTVFPFGQKEPMNIIINELQKIDGVHIIVFPKGLPIFPTQLIKDFLKTVYEHPLWVMRNMDFWGALSLRCSQYYGYKLKYGIDKLMLFQEYSFYSSYLTYLFESERGSLYNLMHGVPGLEACCFRFTKCFVWSEYFKDFYCKNGAKKDQFIISGSIYHAYLVKNTKKNKETYDYDIVYALQGDTHCPQHMIKYMFNVLERIVKEKGWKIVVRPHPIYQTHVRIPPLLEVIEESSILMLSNTKMLVSHFTSMFLDAKILNKKVLAYVPKELLPVVGYLDDNEIVVTKDLLYKKILENFADTALICTNPIISIQDESEIRKVIQREI